MELIHRGLPSRTVLVTSSREMLRIGIPAAGANMMTPIAAGVMTAIAAGFGDNVVAAFGVGAPWSESKGASGVTGWNPKKHRKWNTIPKSDTQNGNVIFTTTWKQVIF